MDTTKLPKQKINKDVKGDTKNNIRSPINKYTAK